jgi:hypothetical protein
MQHQSRQNIYYQPSNEVIVEEQKISARGNGFGISNGLTGSFVNAAA